MAKAKPNNNNSIATIQMPPVKAADAKRSQTLISDKKVASVFNDDCISRLAKLSRLPANADKSRFAQGIRDAVLIYLRDVAIPDENDIHREISKLHQAAQNKRYEKSFEIATHLSEQALAILNRRNLPGVDLLTDPGALLDPARQRQATEQLAALCRNWVPFKPKEGRKRPDGRRSKTFTPDLYAPPASSHFEKRAAERTFLMWLRIAWLDATCERQRARTAARNWDILGPFPKFVCECLKLVGATDVDGIALINEAKKRTFDEACRRNLRPRF